MKDKHVISFTRSKHEVNDLYLGKKYKRSLAVKILGIILILPGCIIFAFITLVVIQAVLNLDEIDHTINYLLSSLFGLLFIIPLVKPIYLEYKKRNQNYYRIFDITDTVNNELTFDEDQLTIKNELYSYSTSWSNVTSIGVGKTDIILETGSPIIRFLIPRKYIDDHSKNLFLRYSKKSS